MQQITESHYRMSSLDDQRFDGEFGDEKEDFERFNARKPVAMPVSAHRRALRESRKTESSRRVSRQIAESRGGICQRRRAKVTLR